MNDELEQWFTRGSSVWSEYGCICVSVNTRKNAQLIAAAPDNYACNIELAKIVRELCGMYGHPLPEASLERSDAAIKKTTRADNGN